MSVKNTNGRNTWTNGDCPGGGAERGALNKNISGAWSVNS